MFSEAAIVGLAAVGFLVIAFGGLAILRSTWHLDIPPEIPEGPEIPPDNSAG